MSFRVEPPLCTRNLSMIIGSCISELKAVSQKGMMIHNSNKCILALSTGENAPGVSISIISNETLDINDFGISSICHTVCPIVIAKAPTGEFVIWHVYSFDRTNHGISHTIIPLYFRTTKEIYDYSHIFRNPDTIYISTDDKSIKLPGKKIELDYPNNMIIQTIPSDIRHHYMYHPINDALYCLGVDKNTFKWYIWKKEKLFENEAREPWIRFAYQDTKNSFTKF